MPGDDNAATPPESCFPAEGPQPQHANERHGGQGPGSARLQHAAAVQLIFLLTIQLSSRCRHIYRHKRHALARLKKKNKKSPQVLPTKLEIFCLVLFKSAALKKKLIIMGKGRGVGKGGVRPGAVGGLVGCQSLGQIPQPGAGASARQRGRGWLPGCSPAAGSRQHRGSFPCHRCAGSAGGRRSPAALPCAGFGPAEHPTVTSLLPPRG